MLPGYDHLQQSQTTCAYPKVVGKEAREGRVAPRTLCRLVLEILACSGIPHTDLRLACQVCKPRLEVSALTTCQQKVSYGCIPKSVAHIRSVTRSQTHW